MCGHYKVEMTVERKSEHYTYRDILLIDIQVANNYNIIIIIMFSHYLCQIEWS